MDFYKMSRERYSELQNSNIQKTYKKCQPGDCENLIQKEKNIATSMGLGSKMQVPSKSEAKVTLKDHKQNIRNNPTCRLLNTNKCELGKVSKVILQDFNCEVKTNWV